MWDRTFRGVHALHHSGYWIMHKRLFGIGLAEAELVEEFAFYFQAPLLTHRMSLIPRIDNVANQLSSRACRYFLLWGEACLIPSEGPAIHDINYRSTITGFGNVQCDVRTDAEANTSNASQGTLRAQLQARKGLSRDATTRVSHFPHDQLLPEAVQYLLALCCCTFTVT
jgi:hypothetical protein